MDHRKTFLENKFSTFDSPTDYSQRIQSDDVQRNREAVNEAGRTKTVHTSEDIKNQGTIPMPTFATRPLTTSSTTLGGISAQFYGWTAKTAQSRSCNSTNSLVHNHSWFGRHDSKIN